MEKTMFHSLVHSQKRFLFFQHHWKEHTLQTPHPVQQSGIWLCTPTGTVLLWVGWTTPPAFPATALATHDSRDTRIQEPGPMACAHAATLFSRLADLPAWVQVVPWHHDSKFQDSKASVPSTEKARLEPLQSAAWISSWQLRLFAQRQHYLGTARAKLNTAGGKCTTSWLIQHCLNLSECGTITQRVSSFCTPSEAYSTAFYSCGIEFTYPCTPKWVPYMLCSKQRLEGLVLSI